MTIVASMILNLDATLGDPGYGTAIQISGTANNIDILGKDRGLEGKGNLIRPFYGLQPVPIGVNIDDRSEYFPGGYLGIIRRIDDHCGGEARGTHPSASGMNHATRALGFTDPLRDPVDFSFQNLSATIGALRAGQARALAVSREKPW